jgi:hypothetical protein
MNEQDRREAVKRRVHLQLLQRETTLRRWARAQGFRPGTAVAAVDRWAGSARLPRGPLAYKILRTLSTDLGHEVVDGILEDA